MCDEYRVKPRRSDVNATDVNGSGEEESGADAGAAEAAERDAGSAEVGERETRALRIHSPHVPRRGACCDIAGAALNHLAKDGTADASLLLVWTPLLLTRTPLLLPWTSLLLFYGANQQSSNRNARIISRCVVY